MDEKIFSRVIPVVIAIVVLIVQYVIKNQKKKNLANTSVPASQANTPKTQQVKEVVQAKEEKAEEYCEEVENWNKLITRSHNITNDSKSNNKKPAFTTMKKNIKPAVSSAVEEIDENNSSIKLSGEEIRKAVIYSEILNPKHF